MFLDSSISDSEIQAGPPYVVIGRLVCDLTTGEVVLDLSVSVPDAIIRHVRPDIDWKRSLYICLDDYQRPEAIERLLWAYYVLYPDAGDFVPGFVNCYPMREGPPPPGEVRAADRGLSNTNKVTVLRIRNMQTGETLEIDKREARLSRMRRRVFAWANEIKDYLPAYGKGKGARKVMITLTYAGVDDWRPNHIRDYIHNLKRRLGDNLIAYAWVAELQERGAVHYHIELIAKKGTRIPLPDKSGMWKHGMSKIETARTVFYICSYLKKSYQKLGIFPKGLRMYSVWVSSAAITDLARWRMRLSTLPVWLCDKISEMPDKAGEKWSRLVGGGYLFGGRVYKSPYFFMGFG